MYSSIDRFSCKADPKEVDLTPIFTLTPSNTDAIDVFTAGSGLHWATTTTDIPNPEIVPLKIIAKGPKDTGLSNCNCDKQWARNDSEMMPATYHYFTNSSTGDSLDPQGSLLKIQIQCVNEEQGLCVAKFSSQYISNDLRNKYKGTWEIQIGTAKNPTKKDALLKDVFYKAYIVIE